MVPRPRNIFSVGSTPSCGSTSAPPPDSPAFEEVPGSWSETEEYVLALGGYDQEDGSSPSPTGSAPPIPAVAREGGPEAAPAIGDESGPAPAPLSILPLGNEPHRTIKSYDLGEKFTGTDKQAHSLEVFEFISRVKAHLKLLNIAPSHHYQYLLLNTRLAAYNALTNNVRLPINDPQAFHVGVSVLQERFGVSRHDLWALARNRRLNIGETTADLIGDLQKYLSYSLSEVLSLSRQCLDWVVAMSFWHALPSSVPGLDNMRTTWLTQVRAGAPLVETALNLTRSVRVEGHEGVALVQGHFSRPTYQHSRGKGKGKGHPVRSAPDTRSASPRLPIVKSISGPRCFNCGGKGHLSRDCPSPRKVTPGSWFWQPDYATDNHLLLLCRFDRLQLSEHFVALIDTGSTVTVLSHIISEKIFGRCLSVSTESIHVRTLTGKLALSRTVDEHYFLGAQMRFLISPSHPLLSLQSTDVHVMLGMDWLFALDASLSVCPGKFPPWTISPQSSASSSGREATLWCQPADVVIVEPDFTLRRRSNAPQSLHCWEVEWKWLSGTEPILPIAKPPCFPDSLGRLSDLQRQLYNDQLQSWVRNNFLIHTDRSELKGILTCFPHVSMDKHTKVRPVLNYVWLNDLLVSCPHSKGPPTTCLGELRSWRTCDPQDWFIIDVTTAYLKLRVAESQQYWQGIIFPDWPEPNTFRLSRVGFGLHIAGKALDRAMTHCLDATTTHFPVKKYVDDVAVHRSDLVVVEKALAQDDLSTKPPQTLAGSSVLGVTITPVGRWTRKKPIDLTTLPTTRKALASLLGKLTAHYPVCGWLRLTCALFTRILALAAPAATRHYDYSIPTNISTAYSHVLQYIRTYGDPIGGVWQITASDPWVLFTDASAIGCAAVLCVGDVLCEDRAWLRDRDCKRHINILEVEAVLRGLGIVIDYMQAICIARCSLTIRTDNMSVVAWLSRSTSRHWTKIHGLFRNAIESRIQLIHDVCKNYHIVFTVEHVSTSANIADGPSRLPQTLSRELLGLVKEYSSTDSTPCVDVIAIQAPSTCSFEQEISLRQWLQQFPISDGKVQLPPDRLGEFLAKVHDHEGHAALLAQLQEYIDAPALASAINHFSCDTCARGKSFPGDRQSLFPGSSIPRAPFPFVRLHSDIAGPYLRSVDGPTRFYLISAIDNYSNFLMVRPTQHSSTSQDVCTLLTSIVHTFHVLPLMLHTDNGTQYSSLAMADLVRSWDAIHLSTPRGSSPSNGRIERVHRYLNEYLRTHHTGKGMSYTTFCDLIRHAVYSWNVTKRRGVSPHSMVYTFPASMGMHVPRQCRRGFSYVESCVVDPPPDKTIPVGTRVLVRCPTQVPKLDFDSTRL
ncbi:gag/pol/env polyprotein, putative, partial [Perkinsus marinus ATCC 50983]